MSDVYFGLTMDDIDYKGILIDTAEYLISNGLLTKSIDYNILKDDIIKFVTKESISRGEEMAKLLGMMIKPFYKERSESYVKTNLKISFQSEIPQSIILGGNDKYVFIRIRILSNGQVEYIGTLTY